MEWKEFIDRVYALPFSASVKALNDRGFIKQNKFNYFTNSLGERLIVNPPKDGLDKLYLLSKLSDKFHVSSNDLLLELESNYLTC